MRITYGLQTENKEVQWFDTWNDVQTAHQKESFGWQSIILVYAMSERVCCIIYNPRAGYFVTGSYENTENGLVDKLAKHGITREMLFGEAIAT